jgi:Do/DeqQ family serine protease
MESTKRLKILGTFLLIVAVTVATNLATNLVTQKNEGFSDQSNQLPAGYAKFASATKALDTDFTVAAELSIHAVVHVKTKIPMRGVQGFGGNGFGDGSDDDFGGDSFFRYFFGQPQQQPQQRRNRQQQVPTQEASGSGVIISNDGYIVTNNHVVDQSSEIEVTLNDKRTFKAKVIGADPNTDIALIKIDAKDLPIIAFGNSDQLKVGEWVLAVGNPFNLTSTVTAGIVSAKARNIGIINSKLKIESFIQTDAAINPGNSGGALVNTRGELIGINTAIASETGAYNGYGFAVPVSIVQKVVGDIRKYGVVQRAMLGVSIGDITDELAKEKKLKTLVGVYVDSVNEESAALKAGIKAGDIINDVNGAAVKSVAELQEQISRYHPGDKITVTVLRDNKPEKFNVELKNSQGSTGIVSAQNSEDVLGATYKELTDKQKQQLGVQYGIEVKSLSKGKLAELGVKPGFIILKVNNKPIYSATEIQTAYDDAMNNGQRDKVLLIAGLYPNGKIIYFAVNLAE